MLNLVSNNRCGTCPEVVSEGGWRVFSCRTGEGIPEHGRIFDALFQRHGKAVRVVTHNLFIPASKGESTKNTNRHIHRFIPKGVDLKKPQERDFIMSKTTLTTKFCAVKPPSKPNKVKSTHVAFDL